MGIFQERCGRKLRVSKLPALSALAIAGISKTTQAALVASDNAGNYAYILGSSFSGQNGGSNSDVLFADLSIISSVPPPASFGFVLVGGLGLAAMALSCRRSTMQA